MSKLGDDLKDFGSTLLRMAFSLIFVSVFVLGEWFIGWLISGTIGNGDESIFAHPPLSWLKEFSIWAVAIVWGVHILTETALWIWGHLPISNKASDDK